jgi:hypothetical protein
MVGIVHTKVSTVADGSTTEHVRPADWNADHTITGTVLLSSGTATNTPLQFVAGTLNTTSTAGAMEFDGTCFYATPVTSARAVVHTAHMVSQTTTRTLTTSTDPQYMFNQSTNGALTVSNGTYFFEAGGALTPLSTNSHTVGWGFAGTATRSKEAWWAAAAQGQSLNTAPAFLSYNTAASTAMITATTNLAFVFRIEGKVVIGASGTLIPSIHIPSANTTATTLTDGYFSIWPVGSTVFGTVGSWS